MQVCTTLLSTSHLRRVQGPSALLWLSYVFTQAQRLQLQQLLNQCVNVLKEAWSSLKWDERSVPSCVGTVRHCNIRKRHNITDNINQTDRRKWCKWLDNCWVKGQSNAMVKNTMFPINFQWDPLRCSCVGCRRSRRRQLLPASVLLASCLIKLLGQN